MLIIDFCKIYGIIYSVKRLIQVAIPIIFLLIILCAFLIVRPVLKKVVDVIRTQVTTLQKLAQDELGVKITFNSLSPAIFTSIHLKGIKISHDGERLIEIKSIRLRYSILRLIHDVINYYKKKVVTTGSLRDLTVDGIVIDMDNKKIEFLNELFQRLKKNENEDTLPGDHLNKTQDDLKKISQITDVSGKRFDIAKLRAIIETFPIDVFVRHVRFLYNDGPLGFNAYMKLLDVDFTNNNTQLSVVTGGDLSVRVGKVYLTALYDMKGTIFDTLDSSNVTLNLRNLTDGNISMNTLNLSAGYNMGKINLHTVQNAYPFYILGIFDTHNKDVDLSVRAQNLNISSVVTARNPNKIFNTLKALTLTNNTVASYNIDNKKLSYSSTGNLLVDSKAISGDKNKDKDLTNSKNSDNLAVTFDVKGTEKKIAIKRLDIESTKLNASASLNCVFAGMQLNGNATLFNYTLDNGTVISTEVFVDSTKDGFVAFAPNIMFNNPAMSVIYSGFETQVHKNGSSIDFNLAVNDYSHVDSEPAVININGSYQMREKFLTANLESRNMFLDSVANTASIFTKNPHTFDLLGAWAFNTEFYASCDFKTLGAASKNSSQAGLKGLLALPKISFNMPYSILINTKNDNQAVYMSLDGSNDSIQISQLDFIMGKFAVNLSGIVERTQKSNTAFVMFDTKIGELPYHMMGNVSPVAISLTGDYGFALDVHSSLDGEDKRFDGSFGFENFPIPVGFNDKGVVTSDYLMYSSLDTGFSYSKNDGLQAVVSRLLLQGTGGRYPFSPKMEAYGINISKYGAFCNKVRYSDIFSNLSGTSSLMWNFNNGTFDNAQFMFTADAQNVSNSTRDNKMAKNRNANSDESLGISLDLSNPQKKPLSIDFLLHDLYFNSQLQVHNFELNRFTRDTSNKNSITGAIIASGTLDNPYIGINIDEFAYTSGKLRINAMLSAFLEEKVLTIENSLFRLNRLDLTNINAKFDLNTLTGNLKTDLDTYAIQRTLHIPLELSIDNVFKEPGNIIPSEATVKLFTNEVSGTWIKKPFGFSFTALHSGDTTTIFSNEEIGLVASITNSGDVNASIDESKPLSFNFSGNLASKELDFLVSDIKADLGPLWAFTNFPYVNIFKAKAEGAIAIRGMKKEPNFEGRINATGIDLNVPIVVPDHITVKEAHADFDHQTIDIPEVEGYIKGSNKIFAKAAVYLNGLALDHVEANLRTPPGKFAPLDLKLDVAEFAGQANANVNLWYQDKYLDITGYVNARRAYGVTTVQQIMGLPPTIIPLKKNKKSAIELMPLPYFIRCDMKINLLNHCTFRLDPLIRAVIAPNGALQFKYDTEDNSMLFDGEIAIRTGDISWLNRNFYLKNGSMKFSPNETTFNPRVSLQAQTREKDSDGTNITLMLDVNNQYLLELAPKITSIPARSEQQLQEILGQVMIADSTGTGEEKKNGGGGISNFALAVGDYALQATIGRAIENKMRDFLHLDILSVRTNVLQNALKINTTEVDRQSIGRRDDFDIQNNVGSYFDNSTLYFGKYLGSHLYMDAMLHTSFDKTRINDPLTANGLVFKPEIGLELESPFANIRWNMSPDISSAMLNKFSASTSITLSWKWAL